MPKFVASYRPEIDGLRAFAILSVIANHFDGDFLPGGFLGVDIFFVISGYVITSSLSKRSEVNIRDFLLSFYERRIKRLVPALVFFVVLTSIAACAFIPNPSDALKTGLSSLFGASNLYLYKQSTDYFSQSTALNPFLHTWSLGIEEQFYLIFPFLIWHCGFYSESKKRVFYGFFFLLALTILSFSLFLHAALLDQIEAYFFLPYRFWEISIGVLGFLYQYLHPKEFKSSKLLSTASILALSAVVATSNIPIYVSVPIAVFCSLLIILSINSGSVLYSLLTAKPFLHIGLISYSLYLWHWSVISISQWTVGIHWFTIPFQMLIIYSLAIFSYKYIERPLRGRQWFLSRSKNIVLGISVLSTISLLPLLLLLDNNKPIFAGSRPEKNKSLHKRPLEFASSSSKLIAKKCHSSDRSNDALQKSTKVTPKFLYDCMLLTDSRFLVAFSGDSHSLSFFPVADFLHSQRLSSILVHSRDGCPFPPPRDILRNGCYEVQSSFIEQALDYSESRNLIPVIVSNSYLNTYFGYQGSRRKNFQSNSDGSRKSVDKNLTLYSEGLTKLANRLLLARGHLIVVAPLPMHPLFVDDLCRLEWYRPYLPQGCHKTDKQEQLRTRAHILRQLKRTASQSTNLHIYDPFEKLCPETSCYVEDNLNPLFADSNHLSTYGALKIAPHFTGWIQKILLPQIID